jgi:hypothetical protein
MIDSDRAVRRYCAVWGRPLPIWKQKGGGNITVKYKGHPITVLEDTECRFIMIYGGQKRGGRPCFILEIDPITKHSTMIDLEAGRWGDTCFTDGYKNSAALVKVAVWAAKRHGAVQLELTDNSTILCPDMIEKIHLSELSFITTGYTWYERQMPGLRLRSFAERLAVWRENVKSRRWAEVAPYVMEVEDQGLAAEKAADVLARMKETGTWCSFFANNMDNLRRAFGIERRIHGSHWYLSLSTGVSESGKRRRTTQKRRSTTV